MRLSIRSFIIGVLILALSASVSEAILRRLFSPLTGLFRRKKPPVKVATTLPPSEGKIETNPVKIEAVNEYNDAVYADSFINPEPEQPFIHNVVIIGSGPAGCTAAIYAGRAMLKPLVIAGYQAGGQLMLTSDVENFPGYKTAITGPALMDDLMTQAKTFGAEFQNVNCKSVNTSSYPFMVTLSNNKVIYTKSVIVATGADALWLNAANEEKYRGKGVSACATCDGFLFQNKSVVVIGGGDSAMEEALFLTRFASDVTIIHRRNSFRSSKVMLQRAQSNPKIRFMLEYEVTEWIGDELLTGALVRNTATNSTGKIKCDGAFIAIGHKPNSRFLGDEFDKDSNGFIKVAQHTMTNIPGVFACGDLVDKRYRQAVTAAGSGCQAAIDAERWLEENSHTTTAAAAPEWHTRDVDGSDSEIFSEETAPISLPHITETDESSQTTTEITLEETPVANVSEATSDESIASADDTIILSAEDVARSLDEREETATTDFSMFMEIIPEADAVTTEKSDIDSPLSLETSDSNDSSSIDVTLQSTEANAETSFTSEEMPVDSAQPGNVNEELLTNLEKITIEDKTESEIQNDAAVSESGVSVDSALSTTEQVSQDGQKIEIESGDVRQEEENNNSWNV